MTFPTSRRIPPSSDRRQGLLYLDIAARLRKRIADGTYAAGSKIPGLHELVSEFEVSTITVRRALRELTSEGLLYGQQGRGVFVKRKSKIHRLLAGDPDKSLGDEIRRAGFELQFEEKSFRKEAGDAETAQRLGLPLGSRLYRHDKVTYVEDEAVSLHSLHIPPDLALRLREGLTNRFIFELLREKGIAFTRSRFEFASVVVDQELSGIFGLRVGYPLLQVRYTPVDPRGKPLLTGVTICRADMFVFEVDLSAPTSAAKPSD